MNLHVLYSFKNLLQVIPLEPYLISGVGLTSIDQEQRATLNLGVGIRIWFGDIFYTRSGFHKDLALDIKKSWLIQFT